MGAPLLFSAHSNHDSHHNIIEIGELLFVHVHFVWDNDDMSNFRSLLHFFVEDEAVPDSSGDLGQARWLVSSHREHFTFSVKTCRAALRKSEQRTRGGVQKSHDSYKELFQAGVFELRPSSTLTWSERKKISRGKSRVFRYPSQRDAAIFL